MPSRQPPAAPSHSAPNHHLHVIIIILAVTTAFSLLTFILFLRRRRNAATSPSSDDPPPHHRFSYSILRRATASFSVSNRLGQGNSGAVFKAILPSSQIAAVKLLHDTGSLQSERDFANELSIASKIDSGFVVSVIGFSDDHFSDRFSDRSNRRRMVLVYELMENGSLQDALLKRKCEELNLWKIRFQIASDVANGLMYLHESCETVIIHGDIKPSNILLDSKFRAKIADFGLARFKCEDDTNNNHDCCVEVVGDNSTKKKNREIVEDNGSIIEEDEGDDEEDKESVVEMRGVVEDPCPEASPDLDLVDKASVCVSEGCFEKLSVDDSDRKVVVTRKKNGLSRDWWWKQDNNGNVSDSGRVKDYVMEWIGNEIKKERPKIELEQNCAKFVRKEKNNRKPREWWKEEFCDELTKKKKKRASSKSNGGDSWWQNDEETMITRKKRKSRASIDWWLEGLSGEMKSGARRNSHDWVSGEIPKSGGISSTPSMRGTVCYIAPEYGGGGPLSEKIDVYSFGVLLLVLISGRRPLQVTASPMSEFERANLISWSKQLAHSGKLLDLVDPCIVLLDKEQALVCITIALLCLQRLPSKRPSMKEIVGMLSGESEPPHLPFEFSPSPPLNSGFKPRKKAR